MANRVQIINGRFQDASGNPLSGGTLVLALNQDAQISGSSGLIGAGEEISVPLDNSGNVQGTVLVWPNDVLLPVNTFYTVRGYSASGQLAWGPNRQQILSSPSPYDLDVWVPNQVVLWVPPVLSVQLQTNGVNNGSQSVLNLAAGTGITLTDSHTGTVTISTGITVNGA